MRYRRILEDLCLLPKRTNFSQTFQTETKNDHHHVLGYKKAQEQVSCIGYICPLEMFKAPKMLHETPLVPVRGTLRVTYPHKVLTMFWSSLNPTPAQPAFPLSSNSTVSPILWYVTKKSQSSLDEQASGILTLPCGAGASSGSGAGAGAGAVGS